MSRVYIVYCIRRLMYPAMAELAIVAGIVIASLAFVSFNDVIQNAQHVPSTGAFFTYLFSAILNTEIAMQVALLVGLVVSAFLFWRTLRTVKSVRGSLAQA